MHTDFGKKKRRRGAFADLVLPIAVFLIVFILFYNGVTSVGTTANDEQLANIQRTVMQSAVHCYAVEGRYPESLDYLEKNYGLNIDHDKYIVYYSVFASNLMPEISVSEKQK